MLQKINNAVTGWIAGIVIVLVALIFVFFGVEGYLQGMVSGRAAAKVNGQSISQQEVTRWVKSMQQSQPTLQADQLHSMVLSHLITNVLLQQSAMQLGFLVSQQQIQQQIMQIPALQENGQFSQTRLAQFLYARQQTESDLVKMVRGEMLLQQLRQLFWFGTSVPSLELNRLYALQQETRDIRYVVLSQDNFMNQIAPPTPTQIKAYYKSHTDQYMLPERVKIAYIMVSPGTFKKQAVISEAQAKTYYEQHASQYQLPARFQIRMVSVPIVSGKVQAAKSKVDIVVKELMQGVPFASIAEANHGAAKPAWFNETELDPTVAVTLAHMKSQQISQPIQTDGAWVIVQKVAASPAKKQDFAKVQSGIVRLLKKQQSSKQLATLSSKLANWVYSNPDSLRPAAKALGLPIATSGWLSQNMPKGLLSDPAILQAAFSDDVLTAGNNSGIVQLKNGSLVVLRVIAHKKAQPKPLMDVQGLILLQLRRLAANRVMQSYATQLQTALERGNLGAVARHPTLQWKTVKALSRGSKALPSALVQGAFALKLRPGVKTAVAQVPLGQDREALVVLQKVDQSKARVPATQAAAFSNVAQQANAEAAFALYHAWLNAKATIKLYAESAPRSA